MRIIICLLASSSLVSIFKCLVSIFKWSELHTVVKSLIQFKPFLFTSNSSLSWNVEAPKRGKWPWFSSPSPEWEVNTAVTWYGQTTPSWMFTFASNSQPQVLLSQEYVLHLLPWARSLSNGNRSGPLGRGKLPTPSHHQGQLQTGSSISVYTRGRSPSGRAVGTVSVCRSTRIRLRVRGHFLLLASTPDTWWSWGPLHLAWGWDREPYRQGKESSPSSQFFWFLQRNLSSFYQPKAGPSGLTWHLTMGVCIPSSILSCAMPSSYLSFLIMVLWGCVTVLSTAMGNVHASVPTFKAIYFLRLHLHLY